MTEKSHKFRLYIRLSCFILAICLLLPFPFWIHSSGIVVQSSVFVTISTILAGGAFGVGSILGLGFAVISLMRKRWFCRHVCPVGLLLDTVSGMKFPAGIWWKGCPHIGRYIVLLTFAGAIVGYPLFLWMDPLAFLNNAFSVYTASGLLSGIVSLAGIVILLMLTLTSGNLWCARICPLGATQDILENIGSFCGNFMLQRRADAPVTTEPGSSFPTTRRIFLTIVAGLGLSLVAKKTGLARSQNALLRPPGAVIENEFTGLCLRCGNCIRTCPSGIIHPDKGQAGVVGFLAPVVRYIDDYCNEECNDCTKTCPSGAIKALSLEQKNEYIIGQARVDMALCLWGINDCNKCLNACPFEAINVHWDEEAYESYPAVDPLKCNGCGACEAYCPTGDLKAITVKHV